MDKVKALLTPAPKTLAGKELVLATKDVVGPSLCTLQQLTQTCGHQEPSWKGNASLDKSPVINQVMSFQKWPFIQLFQWPQDYLQAISLSVSNKLKTTKCSCHWIHWNVLWEATRLNSNFRLAQPPSNSAKISLCRTGRSLICISVVQKLFALVPHWALQTHSLHTPCSGKCHMKAPSGTEPLMCHFQNQPCRCCCCPSFSLLIPAWTPLCSVSISS